MYTAIECESIKHKLNLISYNTRYVSCADGLLNSFIEQANTKGLLYKNIKKALDNYIDRTLDKMPKITEILQLASTRDGYQYEGCNRCEMGGLFSVYRHDDSVPYPIEVLASCTCDKGKSMLAKNNIPSITDCMANGYKLTINSEIMLGLYIEREEDKKWQIKKRIL